MFYEKVLASYDPLPLREPLKPGEYAYINRELSWMEFNERVLEEARDKANPLYERLNFMAITGSNLDEHFMIRAASLISLVQAGGSKPDPAGMTPKEQLSRLMDRCQDFVKKQYSTYNRQLIPALAEEGIEIVKPSELDDAALERLEKYFDEHIFPVLSPIAVDAARPFPLLANDSLNLIVLLQDRLELSRQELEKHHKGSKHKEVEADDLYPPIALLQVPRNLSRLYLSGEHEGVTQLVMLEDILIHFMSKLFDNQTILEAYPFRILRDADFEIDEDDVADLLVEIEERVAMRKRGAVIRLTIDHRAPKIVRTILQEVLDVPDNQVFRVKGPLDLTFIRKVSSLVPRPELHYRPFSPQLSPGFSRDEDPFACIRQGDILLHHPYETFDDVIRVIRKAAKDPQVLAIKQTLYRVSGKSPIVKALADAAQAGKQVLVLVELKARFDEENNIHWARELEKAGCHVLYGLKGLKTHSKITLIVREEADGIRRYVHLGTGNYNDSTAKIYTDLGIWSCSERVGEDASKFFNMISGYSLPRSWKQIIPAPRWLRDDTIFRIRREAEHATKGRKAMIVAKVNSLLDEEIIEELYKASQAGVIIRLIVRGISSIRPGIKDLSENIEVRSLVGRFLEHSRIFYYYNDGEEDLLFGSADWMPRNLDRRIEIVSPIYDAECRRRVFEILNLELADTERARIEQSDGYYKRVDRRGKEILDSQIALCELATAAAAKIHPDPLSASHYEVRTSPAPSSAEED